MQHASSRCLAGMLALSLAAPWPARAHNEAVHPAMTDDAYQAGAGVPA